MNCASPPAPTVWRGTESETETVGGERHADRGRRQRNGVPCGGEEAGMAPASGGWWRPPAMEGERLVGFELVLGLSMRPIKVN